MSFPTTGHCVSKPELILKLEQEEEPWILKGQLPSESHPGELMRSPGRQPGETGSKVASSGGNIFEMGFRNLF